MYSLISLPIMLVKTRKIYNNIIMPKEEECVEIFLKSPTFKSLMECTLLAGYDNTEEPYKKKGSPMYLIYNDATLKKFYKRTERYIGLTRKPVAKQLLAVNKVDDDIRLVNLFEEILYPALKEFALCFFLVLNAEYCMQNPEDIMSLENLDASYVEYLTNLKNILKDKFNSKKFIKSIYKMTGSECA